MKMLCNSSSHENSVVQMASTNKQTNKIFYIFVVSRKEQKNRNLRESLSESWGFFNVNEWRPRSASQFPMYKTHTAALQL